MSGGSVGFPIKARRDPASYLIQTMTDSADPVIHSQQTLIEQSTNEDGRRAGDSEWMDIDDISFRIAGVHLT